MNDILPRFPAAPEPGAVPGENTLIPFVQALARQAARKLFAEHAAKVGPRGLAELDGQSGAIRAAAA